MFSNVCAYLHTTVVDDHILVLDARIHLGHFLTALEEVPAERKKAIQETMRQVPDDPPDEVMMTSFTMEEMEEDMKSLKSKKSPGPDCITNEMILHLGRKSKEILLKIFNTSWKTGSIPQAWRDAEMIPIHKKGKDKTKADSYRKKVVLDGEEVR